MDRMRIAAGLCSMLIVARVCVTLAHDFTECKRTRLGQDYRGTVSVTESGKTCQFWNRQYPHKHNFKTPARFVENSFDDLANYCRNPDREPGGPWCYTTDSNVRWQYCDVPICRPTRQCKSSKNGAEYRGLIAWTLHGKKCKRWLDLTTQEKTLVGSKSAILSEDHENFCRNPNGFLGPWCFVDGEVGLAEYCDVRSCDECQKSNLGSAYKGTVNVTWSGKQCQAWASQYPHKHGFKTAARFLETNFTELNNYCRNPDDEIGGPWCYTTDPGSRWEYCSIPECWPYSECRLTEKGTEYRGSQSVDSDGNVCKRWSDLTVFEVSQMKTQHRPIPGDEHINFCRNLGGADEPWCFLEGLDGKLSHCNVPYCKPSSNCKTTERGSEYAGTISATEDGVACQRWDKHFPDSDKESLVNAENFCRNPISHAGPWCFTQDPKQLFGLCDVPFCKDCKMSKSGWEYSGTLAVTRNGRTCQNWSSNSPHSQKFVEPERFPDASIKAAKNYCRSPTGSDREHGPWCYTTDTDVEWEYCHIPPCDEPSHPDLPLAHHVVYIGVDGLAPCFVNASGGATNIQRLGKEGTSTLTMGRTDIRASSPSGWASALCGMDSSLTGVTDEDWMPSWRGGTVNISPVTGRDIMMPCIFHELKSRNTNIRTASFYDWMWLRHMSSKGFPGYVDHEFMLRGDYSTNDEKIKDAVVQYLNNSLVSSEKSATVVYLGNLDAVGRSSGWCGSSYLEAVKKVDDQVGEILDVIDNFPDEKVLVILSSDHGGSGTIQGLMRDSDLIVPMYLRGPGIKKETNFTRPVQPQDILPTIFYSMGLKPSSWWSGKVMMEAFEKHG